MGKDLGSSTLLRKAAAQLMGQGPLKRLLLILAAMALAQPASASVTQTSKVRYERDGSKSQWYPVEVNYMTSQELNAATKSLRYGAFDHYAIIFWGRDEATVIKLRGFFSCGERFIASCIPSFGNMRGVDQQDRGGEICAQEFCY